MNLFKMSSQKHCSCIFGLSIFLSMVIAAAFAVDLSPPRGGSARFAVPDAASSSDSSSTSSAIFSDAATTMYDAGELVATNTIGESRGPLKVLFLSSDTGGGHRASAESLAKQFLLHFPGSTYDLLDIWTEDGVWPYRVLVNSYKHLSAHPNQWRVLYHLSNTKPWEVFTDWHSVMTCERRIRKRIASFQPDVIVSVHPTMNNAPLISTRKLSKSSGKHLPFFTVVTDLASAHCTWFQRDVDRMYVASDRLRRLARRRGRTPDENVVMSGLPIRHEFALAAEHQGGDRLSEGGKHYQRSIKEALQLPVEKPMVLVMGGGEGVGSLSVIVEELVAELTKKGVDATICVVCGRNEKLQDQLATRDWDEVVKGKHEPRHHRWFLPFVGRHPSRHIQQSIERADKESEVVDRKGDVTVVPLGFISNMADYMVAAEVLVSKAGPGTIAEAAAVGLPVMLTSFLPGQEAGNVDYVLDNGFGDFCKDPQLIAQEVCCWLRDEPLLREMSECAHRAGHPHAAADIVLDIGSITHTWMALNGE